MIEADLEDTHLCIKCSSTIVGLDNYIQHRKRNCGNVIPANESHKIPHSTTTSRTTSHELPTSIMTTTRANLSHSYDNFTFPEPEAPSTYAKQSEHGGKTSKSLADSYELPYELGADVFFSSLQLQSVQSTGLSTSGKTSTAQQTQLQRQKSSPMHHEQTEHTSEVAWMDAHASASGQHSTDTLMKAVSDISEVKKPYEVFKPITFGHESPDASEDEEGDVEMEDDDEDYEPLVAAHATGGKWKLPLMRHSPPVVPATHTGGKWKPEHRPNLRVTHTQLTRLSPSWDEQPDDLETVEVNTGEHPPAEHTKGKWVPGTKVQRLEYKEEVELAKSSNQDYWCNICCRKLKSKAIYENHLKTSFHLKRAEPEQQLEKVTLSEHGDISKNFVLEEAPPLSKAPTNKKRRRRTTFIKCELCKHVMLRHLVGKHLISHYHYRRMQMNPGKSLRMILDNIHSIVLQSPFQCRPCRFYANTEETFLLHWNSREHLDASEGPGKFWCSYCRFECEDNNQMRRHLLSSDHCEVILAINRSVPICISKKLSIDCGKCRQSFRYNVELRSHLKLCHPNAENTGTASDLYQGRFMCSLCGDCFHSKVALQRHEKRKHSVLMYFCSICKLEFSSPCQARRHRKTVEHKLNAATIEKMMSIKKQKGFHDKKAKNSRECDKCEFVATSEVEAMLHELSHSKKDFNNSSLNVKPSTSKKAAEYAKRSQANETKASAPIKCKDCLEICANKEALKDHRATEHPLLVHICMSCGENFATAQALGRHTRLCQPSASSSIKPPLEEPETPDSNDKTWKCEQCNFCAPYESELIFHRVHHTYGPIAKSQFIKCPLCPKEFSKRSLRCHLRQHTNEKIFECEFCNLKFGRRDNLKNHINKIHKQKEKTEETVIADTNTKATTKAAIASAKSQSKKQARKGKYQCDTCGKIFTLKHALETHKLSHDVSVESRYVCTHEGCQYVAMSRFSLKVHSFSHSKESFKCDFAGCKYVGKSMLHLKRHSQFHDVPTKLYACENCEFKARLKGHMKRHMRCHTGEKPHQCPYCDFRCNTIENLRKHVLKTNKHPGKYIYECNFCVQNGADTKTLYKTNYHQEYQKHLATEHNKNK